MKILTIGDLHGKDNWLKFADIEWLLKATPEAAGNGAFEPEYDYYIFLGDYVDAHDQANDNIYTNLDNVIGFKKLYPKNVILLWGNHEIAYLFDYDAHPCTGFRPDMYKKLHEIFNINKNLFQLAFQLNNYLWTHAGLHKGWYKYKFEKYDTEPTIADGLNKLFNERNDIIFDCGWDRGGTERVGGPLWIDKDHTYKKPIDGYHQIVGHTRVKCVKTYKIKEETTITFCDCVTNNDYYTIEI